MLEEFDRIRIDSPQIPGNGQPGKARELDLINQVIHWERWIVTQADSKQQRQAQLSEGYRAHVDDAFDQRPMPPANLSAIGDTQAAASLHEQRLTYGHGSSKYDCRHHGLQSGRKREPRQAVVLHVSQ